MRTLGITLAATSLLALPQLAQAQVKIQIQAQPNAKVAQFAPVAGGGKVNLLQSKDVQGELKLSEEQVAKIGDIAKNNKINFKDLPRDRAERAKKLKEIAETQDKAIAGVLKPEQIKRLEQIENQRMGLRNPAVAEKLGISAEQKTKMQEIQKESYQELRNVFKNANQGNREEIQKKIAEHREKTDKKVADVLTPEQKAKWKEMTGAPFKGQMGGVRNIQRGQIQLRQALPIQPAQPKKVKPQIQ